MCKVWILKGQEKLQGHKVRHSGAWTRMVGIRDDETWSDVGSIL